MGKLLFYHFRVTNSRLQNKKFHFELLIRKMKEQNLDFEIARDVFIELKYYTIQNYLEKNIGMLDFVILHIDLASNRYCFRLRDYLAYALPNDNAWFLKKLLLVDCFVAIKYLVFI